MQVKTQHDYRSHRTLGVAVGGPTPPDMSLHISGTYDVCSVPYDDHELMTMS